MITQNAIITDASVQLDRGFILTAWLMLDYGSTGQGFGGYVLGGSDGKAGEHDLQKNICAEFIVACLRAGGVEKFSDLVGKTIRVRKTDEFGDIIAIGHIVKEDRWFDAATRLGKMAKEDGK